VGVEKEVRVPDIGDFEDVEVIEVLVASGDVIDADASIVTLESDKATMEVPCPFGGVVREVRVRVGDRVSEGTPLLTLDVGETSVGEAASPPAEPTRAAPSAEPTRAAPPTERSAPRSIASPQRARATASDSAGHASPSVRRFARELGVDVAKLRGSGRKGRILRTDVQSYVKEALRGAPPAESVVHVGPAPTIDFASFGAIDVQPLSKVRRLSAANLHRAWVTVPHVTQHDEADITDLEALRRESQGAAEAKGVKLTLLAFVMKAVAANLREFPQFCASLDESGENLVMKRYCHIGVAVDTPVGLVVPVVRDVDRKDAFAVAAALGDLSERARKRRLRREDLEGGCFSISSLGGIGGTGFTPIVNAPEVAILGVSRHSWKPVFTEGSFVPRIMLPLSLSYDHRVIDGADAVRFTTRLRTRLADGASAAEALAAP